MSKEYIDDEAIKRIEKIAQQESIDKKRCGANVEKVIIDEFAPSKAIDNANPSEAMNCLERIDKEYATIGYEDFNTCYKTIQQTLLKAQEQEKVLEIIKKKKIDVNNFQTSLMVMSNFTYRYYINNSRDYHTCIMFELLTEEEFNLLKRYFENEHTPNK